MEIDLSNARQADGIVDDLTALKNKIEQRFNLSQVVGNEKQVVLTTNKIMRICLLVGLNISSIS